MEVCFVSLKFDADPIYTNEVAIVSGTQVRLIRATPTVIASKMTDAIQKNCKLSPWAGLASSA